MRRGLQERPRRKNRTTQELPGAASRPGRSRRRQKYLRVSARHRQEQQLPLMSGLMVSDSAAQIRIARLAPGPPRRPRSSLRPSCRRPTQGPPRPTAHQVASTVTRHRHRRQRCPECVRRPRTKPRACRATTNSLWRSTKRRQQWHHLHLPRAEDLYHHRIVARDEGACCEPLAQEVEQHQQVRERAKRMALLRTNLSALELEHRRWRRSPNGQEAATPREPPHG